MERLKRLGHPTETLMLFSASGPIQPSQRRRLVNGALARYEFKLCKTHLFLLVLFAGIIARTVQVALRTQFSLNTPFAFNTSRFCIGSVSADFGASGSSVAIPFFIFWHRKRDDIPRPLTLLRDGLLSFFVVQGISSKPQRILLPGYTG